MRIKPWIPKTPKKKVISEDAKRQVAKKLDFQETPPSSPSPPSSPPLHDNVKEKVDSDEPV
jgi:hypothetical protein